MLLFLTTNLAAVTSLANQQLRDGQIHFFLHIKMKGNSAEEGRDTLQTGDK